MIRPRERLLRNRIPKEELRRTLEKWSDRLSDWEECFTAIVVLGLVIEYLPEILYFIPFHLDVIIRPHAEQLRQFGGLLVVIGVAGELWIGFRASRVETDLRGESSNEIAALNADTERLRKENNEMALLLSYRSLGDLREFEKAMKAFAGTKCSFEVHPNGEAQNLYHMMSTSLERAGWIKIGTIVRRPGIGFGVAVNTIAASVPSPRSDPAIALADWLHRNHVSVVQIVIAGSGLEAGTILISVGPKPDTLEQLRLLEEAYKHWPHTAP